MKEIPSIIEALWHEGQAKIPNQLQRDFLAQMQFIQQRIIDIWIEDRTEPAAPKEVGFIELEKHQDGAYSLSANTPHHTALKEGEQFAVGVDPACRRQGIGSALLSLGVGVAQQDFSANPHPNGFEIWGVRPTPEALPMYRKFGFKIMPCENIRHLLAYHSTISVPPIYIHPILVSNWRTRLRSLLPASVLKYNY